MDSLSENEIVSKRIEGYLHALEYSLVKVDAPTAQELLQEIRLHLHASTAEFMTDGKAAKEAAQMAIDRFGPIYKVGPKLSMELRRGNPSKAKAWSKRIVNLQIFLLCYATASWSRQFLHDILWHIAFAMIVGVINGFLETLRRGGSEDLSMIKMLRPGLQAILGRSPKSHRLVDRLAHAVINRVAVSALRRADQENDIILSFGFWFYARIALSCGVLYVASGSPFLVYVGLLCIVLEVEKETYKVLRTLRPRPS